MTNKTLVNRVSGFFEKVVLVGSVAIAIYSLTSCTTKKYQKMWDGMVPRTSYSCAYEPVKV
jgi:hypothetical protein